MIDSKMSREELAAAIKRLRSYPANNAYYWVADGSYRCANIAKIPTYALVESGDPAVRAALVHGIDSRDTFNDRCYSFMHQIGELYCLGLGSHARRWTTEPPRKVARMVLKGARTLKLYRRCKHKHEEAALSKEASTSECSVAPELAAV